MKERTSLVFTGDIGFDRYMDGRFDDEGLISEEVRSFCVSADHVIANVEGALVPEPANTETCGVKQLRHTMDPGAVHFLNRIHADIWNLANNHIMDAGPEGLSATLEEAFRAGARTIGAGMDLHDASKPLILPDAGGIGIFAVGYRRGCKPAGPENAGCFSWAEMDLIRKTIESIKKTCRWCVVVSHGGEEFTALPAPYTRTRYLDYLNMGADLVVCHHPHVPMNYELFGEKAIFYSLGNFIFDTDYQRAQYHTDEGVLLRLDFTEESFSFEALGLRLLRDAGKVVSADLPVIFRDVPEKDYRLLSPLAAKMFISATKRQQLYLHPDEFNNASLDKWAEHFANPLRSGRVPGEALDFLILCPLAEEAEKGAWRESALKDVTQYILDQL